MERTIPDQCGDLRAECLVTEKRLLELKQRIAIAELSVPPQPHPAPDRPEMLANVTLAYRHLEDARMRLGKVIQAYDGGTSCYPR